MAAYRTKMAKLEAEVNEQKRDRDRLEDEVNRLRNSEAELKKNLQTSRDRHKEDKDKALEWRKSNYMALWNRIFREPKDRSRSSRNQMQLRTRK